MNYHRIEVALEPGREDPGGGHIAWEIKSTLGYRVRGVRTVSVYTVYADLPDERIHAFASQVLSDPVLSIYTVDSPVGLRLPPFTWAVEISFKRGVTDNVGHTAAEVLAMMNAGGSERGERVFKSTQFLFDADLDLEQVRLIGSEILYNDLIEDMEILSREQYIRTDGFPFKERHLIDDYKPQAKALNLAIPDEGLVKLSSERTLALTLREMKFFRAFFERPGVAEARREVGLGSQPTDVELECFAQTQSEHCKHKIFNARIIYRTREGEETIHSLFDTCIRAATEEVSAQKDFLVSVFSDNAGVIEFDDLHNLAFKVETHNSPSALDPYGGSITGIVGCDRDPAGTGLGARLIAHTDVLCFGDPYMKGELPPRMMHPKRIMEGVIKGIEDGGNKCGIPTVDGAVIFHESYRGKPLVFCGSVGIMPRTIGEAPSHVKEVRPGDLIVMIGGRIGKDGIHGATFSSEEISETSPVQAVQIGDPITQKKMLDMVIEARDLELYRAITDNGAGGLSSSVGEMARLSGGALLALEKAPLKYPGLDPWEILLSEAQERMTLAVPPENLDRFLELAIRRDVLAVPLGRFTDSGYFHATYEGRTICYLDLTFLHANIPLCLEARWDPPIIEEREPVLSGSLVELLLELVGDLNICSREPVIRRYDHEVGGNTVLKPLVGIDEAGPADGGVIAPVPGSNRGFVLAAGINPFYSEIDAYLMAANAVDEAVRNAVAVGADPDRISLLDNFCWPDPVHDSEKTPDGRYKLAQLVRAARGCHDTAVAYGTPFISGKDSMKNDYKIGAHKVSVLPTVLISALGIVPDVRTCVSPDFKEAGDAVYLMGNTGRHLGQSLLYRKYGGSSARGPVVETGVQRELYRVYHRLVGAELLASGHDLSEGGLAVSLMECCIGGGIGAEVDLEKLMEGAGLGEMEALFSESAGRFLVSVDTAREQGFLSLTRGLPVLRIGETGGRGSLVITRGGSILAEVPVNEMTRAFRDPLYRLLGMQRG
jgi:phosphoribosylformylglycinamidine synthase II